ncbi:MAG TPA: hypothetical protein VGC76_09960 [Pyrinomonadaceae bacterium]|jgi:uncharacterized membrane protein
MAKKKFDTNPLDPEFPQKIKEAQTTALPQTDAATQRFSEPTKPEEQTQQFNQANFGAYQSPYDGQQVPANYQTSRLADVGRTSKRKVAKVGLPENIMTALPYLPVWLGLVAGILELVFVPKSEAKVRFHAAQAAAAHIGILIILAILDSVDGFLPFGNIAYRTFWVVSTVMLIVFCVKAYQGKPVHIESVEDLTEWLEDKIKPKN